MLGALATLLAGLFYPVAFPPQALWPIAFVSLAPFLVALRTARTDLRASALAVLWTFTWCASLVGWLPETLASYYHQPFAVGVVGAAGIASLTGAIDYAALALCHRRLGWVPGLLRPIAVASAWVAAELARAKFFSGNPWALVGYTQTAVPQLLQVAGVTGIYGVGFVVVLVNAALAELWMVRRGTARQRWGGLGGLAVAGLAVAASWTYGARVLADAVPPRDTAPVLVVQTDAEVFTQWDRTIAANNLLRYASLTSTGLAQAPATKVVFWPENAITFDVERDPLAVTIVADTLRGTQTQLVAGAPRGRRDGGAPYDSALLFGSNGRVRGWQDKRFPIPFVEYFPYGGESLMGRDFGAATTISPGRLGAPLPTAAGAAGVLICNEALFPEAAADLVGAGAHYLVNLANDTWHGGTYALEAFEVMRVRAVEQGRYVVRASTSGPSGIVDAWGRTVAITTPSVAATVAGAVGDLRGRTLYGLYGDWFAYVCVLVAAACGLWGWAQ